MAKRIEYKTGDMIGKCVFLKDAESIFYGKAEIRMAVFKCWCGKEFCVSIGRVKSGNTNSCGCYRKGVTSKLNFKHGEGIRGKETPEYIAWQAMITRCYNENQDQYKDYGGRGIRVCDKWRKSFKSFLDDVGRKPTSSHSLDRWPDKNGNYEPGNIRWATVEQQANNKRNNNYFSVNGEHKTIPELAKLWGVKPTTLYSRAKRSKGKKCYPCNVLKNNSSWVERYF